MPSFTENINVNGHDMPVYASVPSGSGPFPAVVVIQAAGGVNDFIRGVSDNLAAEGYAAVAPDLFHRMGPEIPTEGTTRAQNLNDWEIRADVDATVDFLLAHPAIDSGRIGITGFCMGGRVTWLAAATNPNFKAAVPYYGGNLWAVRGDAEKTPFELTEGINCPILFHFGEIDANPSQEDMAKLDEELTRLDKAHQFFVYPGADHAFMDHTGPRYHRESAEISWPRTLHFFATHLKGAAVQA